MYPASGAAVRAVILGRPFEDLFVVADQPFDSTSKSIALRIVIFPLIRWVWIGSILLVRRRRRLPLAQAPEAGAGGAGHRASRGGRRGSLTEAEPMSDEHDRQDGAAPLEIEVEGLRKTFGRREVLKGLSFGVPRGGFLSIFGPNGAGKTTTLRVLATLLTPSGGSIKVAGPRRP